MNVDMDMDMDRCKFETEKRKEKKKKKKKNFSQYWKLQTVFIDSADIYGIWRGGLLHRGFRSAWTSLDAFG